MEVRLAQQSLAKGTDNIQRFKCTSHFEANPLTQKNFIPDKPLSERAAQVIAKGEAPSDALQNVKSSKITSRPDGKYEYKIPATMLQCGITIEQASSKITAGKILYKSIVNGTHDVNTNPLSKEEAAKLLWFLEYQACSKNPNFMSKEASTLRIPDDNKKIYAALNSVVDTYNRAAPGKSSHFKSVPEIQKTQRGLDFPKGTLPFGSRTLLLANWQEKSCTYIKLESRGINSGFLDLIMHGINFLKKINRKVDKSCDFRESSIPLPKQELQKYKQYGKTVFQIREGLGKLLSPGEGCCSIAAFNAILVNAGIGDNQDTRLGRELILNRLDLL